MVSAYIELGRLARSVAVNFAETAITDPEVLAELLTFLNEEAGVLDRVFDVTINDNDVISGKAEERITQARSQIYTFQVNGKTGEGVYKLLNTAEMAEFVASDGGWAEVVEYAAKKTSARAGKKLNCKPGNVQCGGKCQSGNKNCRFSPTPDKAASAQAIASKAKGKKTAAPKATTAPATVPDAKPPATPKKSGTAPPSTAKPTLKSKPVNPNAIPDMKPDQFREFMKSRERLKTQYDPGEVHNQSFDDWKSQGTGRTRSQYQSAISNAINAGFVPSDSASASAKLTKAQQARVAQNRQEQSKQRAEVDRVQRAIDHPLVDPDETKDWKPRMSREEADQYTDGTFAHGVALYHGNSKGVIDSMETDGVQPERNSRGIFGQGGYFAASKEEAELYYNSSSSTNRSDGGIIEARARVQNPFVSDSENLARMASNFPGDQSNNADSVAMNEYLRAKGYDSIYLQDRGYFVTFDARQTVITDVDRVEYGSDRQNQIQQFWSDKLDLADSVAVASQSPSYQQLAPATPNKERFTEYTPDDFEDFEL